MAIFIQKSYEIDAGNGQYLKMFCSGYFFNRTPKHILS